MEYGCIGEKLGHSFSKIIHNKLYHADYELKEIPKEALRIFLTEKNFKAINVTIPYKQDVIPFLDEISDTAKKIGAVNTVVNKNGKLYGFNTDFEGLKALILKNEISLKGKKVLILGSGGTSKTAFAVAEALGAKEIYRISRKETKETVTYEQMYETHTDAQILINTTPCGMFPSIGVSAVDIGKFKNLQGVVDAVYNPLNSHLVVSAKERGIKAVGGLYMLVAQGVFAAEKFLGKEFPRSQIDRIFNEILLTKRNIVLIGMPSSGKTTIGKALAKDLGLEFADTDDLIVKNQNMPITEIFKSKGETGFREIEGQIIKEASALQGFVIATGGGAILRKENVELLKENGVLVFLDRSIENLITTDSRPLSSNRTDLQKRYDERYVKYCQSADLIIDANGSVETNKNSVLKGLKL